MRIKVLFFIKDLSGAVWTLLTFYFMLLNMWHRVSIFSVPWQIVIFLNWDQLPTFHPFCFQCCEIPLRISLTWSFLPVLLPLEYLNPFCSQPFYSHKLIAISWNFIYIMILISLCVNYFYLFAALLSLLSNFLFQLSIFIKCHMGFSLPEEETQVNAFASCVWTE